MAASEANLRLLLTILDDDDLEVAASAIQAVSSATIWTGIHLQSRKKLRDSTVHVENYVEETVPRYTNLQFMEHFRMRIDVFQELLEWMAPSMPKERTISLEKNLLATLWYLGNMETYRSVADRFGLSKGSLQRVVFRVCTILVQRQQEWIRWPSTIAEMERLAQQFAERCNFPGVISAIDGTHIEIPGPSVFRDSYIDRKGTPSMHLQVACSKDLLFTDIYTGWPGSVHDARVFRNSPVGNRLENEDLDRRFHVLGDSAYPLSTSVLVPFKDNGHLDALKKSFNKAHSSTRVEVERACIGLLKGKWRKLKYLEMKKVDNMPEVITAACVLHNYVILKQGFQEDDIITVQMPQDDPDRGCPPQNAQDKRMEIAYQLA